MSLESPQLEDGFTPIANGIMDALARTRFSGYERSVLDFLFRKTYGWSKKSDLIALSQFVDATGISKSNIVHTINRLAKRNIIQRTVAKINNGSLTRYEFNKHWGTWISLSKSTTPSPSLLNPTMIPLFKSTPTISISTTTSKRLEDKEGVVTQKRMNRKVPLLTFDPPTQSVVGELEEARQRFSAAFPKSDFDRSMETMRVWIVKKGNPHKTYWKSLCTFASGEVPMKKFSVGEVGKSNMGEEWG